jgi:carbon starvation protein CstA
MRNCILLAVQILVIAYFMTKIDFSLIWRYFAFSNMLLSTSVLWLATKDLFDRGTFHWIVSITAIIGTSVTVSYIMTAGIGFNLPSEYSQYSQYIGIVVAILLLSTLVFLNAKRTVGVQD